MQKTPISDRRIGINFYLSKTPGIGGRIKQEVKDFIVEEITPDGEILRSKLAHETAEKSIQVPKEEDSPKADYTTFVLEKVDWDTMRAIKVIAKRAGYSRKRFKFAGTKDKRGISVQRVSAWNVPIEKLSSLNITGLHLRDFAYSDEPINLGELEGNHFTITIRDLRDEAEVIEKKINSIINELDNKVPNFFGNQRFGNRCITHEVGRMLVNSDFEGAVMVYLSATDESEAPWVSEARKEFSKTRDPKKAIETFPKFLGYERSMLNYLINQPTDYIGALRRLPKKLRWMFVHAYQSHIFNRALSRYLEKDPENIPEELCLPGFEIKSDEVTKEILDEEGISESEFRIPSMPELDSGGEMRKTMLTIRDLELKRVDDDTINPGRCLAVLEFTLSKGCYATTVLREIMKN